LRIEANREFVVKAHSVAPYVHYEWFYDTRHDGWARMLLEDGAEFTVNPRLR
jgi:hypothetical protein